MNIDGIIFDLDGTIWDSTEVVSKAWNQVLSNTKEIKKIITKEDMEGVMGLQLPEIGEKLFTGVDVEMRERLMESCCNLENDLIRQEGGRLYPNLEETLEILSKKYPLFIVSNCQHGYIEAFFSYHKIEKLFVDFEDSGDRGFSKGENIKRLIKKNGLKNPVYVGDTQGDCDAARFANIPFIYAKYGFGKVKNKDYIIESIDKLIELLIK